MRWLACELHTHTFHSDGKQSLMELARGAGALGFECVALTDHNTMSGLADREAVERETGLTVIGGMEWTTFYGHMVTLGVRDYFDWRIAGPSDIHAGIEAVQRGGGLAGIAHPFRIGSPICTGCYWEYEIMDWKAVDYIEVWSGTFPSVKYGNRRAFEWWTTLLNEGHRIAASAGRDWHRQEPTNDPVSVTYLGVDDGDEPLAERCVQALANGRAVLTMGPLLLLEAEAGGLRYRLGERLPAGAEGIEAIAWIRLDYGVRTGLWPMPGDLTVRLSGSAGVIHECKVDGERFAIPLSAAALLWIRAELWGELQGIRTLIAFTNPIYIERMGETWE